MSPLRAPRALRPRRRTPRPSLALAAVAVLTCTAGPALATQQIQVASGFNGAVRAIAGPDANGTTFLGGEFTALDAWDTGAGALLSTSTGAVDTSLPKMGGLVYSAADDGSGGLFVGGAFHCVGGDAGGDGDCTDQGEFARNNAAHVLPDGSVDPTWDPDVTGVVKTIAVTGGAVYIGGTIAAVNSGAVVRNGLAKVSATGTGAVDATWNPNMDDQVLSLVYAGGYLYAAGQFSHANGGTARNGLAKIPASGNGTVDASWDPNANGIVESVARSGTDLIVGGWFTTMNGGTVRNRLAKVPLAGNGTVDATWNPNVGSTVNTVSVSGTDVFVGGAFTTINGATTRHYVAKIPVSGNGTVDPTWNPDAGSSVLALAVLGTDVYLGGDFTTINGGTVRSHLARTPESGTGTVDAWDPNPNGDVMVLAHPTNGMYAGGDISRMNGTTRRNHLAAISSSGVLTSWDPGTNDTVRALGLAGSDVIAGGDFTTVNTTTTRNHLARFSAAGTADATWNPNVDGEVDAIAVTGTDVYAGGNFGHVNGGTARLDLAKFPLSGNGTADAAWDPSANSQVLTLVAAGTSVYAGGFFTQMNGGTTRNRLAKIPMAGNGTVDATWNANANNAVHVIQQVGTDLYVGGEFTTINGGGIFRTRLARIPLSSANGIVDSWAPGANGTVYAIAGSADGIYVGGDFTSVNGATPRQYVARISPSGTGTADAAWHPGVLRGPNNVFGYPAVVSALQPWGSGVLVGGDFATAGGLDRNDLAGIGADGVVGAALPAPPPAPDAPTGGSDAPTGGGGGASSTSPEATGTSPSAPRSLAALSARLRCAKRVCTITGRVPVGAARVAESGQRTTGAGVTGRCTIRRPAKGATGTTGTRSYTCTLRAPKGTWTITTTAFSAAGAAVAQAVVVKTLK